MTRISWSQACEDVCTYLQQQPSEEDVAREGNVLMISVFNLWIPPTPKTTQATSQSDILAGKEHNQSTAPGSLTQRVATCAHLALAHHRNPCAHAQPAALTERLAESERLGDQILAGLNKPVSRPVSGATESAVWLCRQSVVREPQVCG